MEFQLDRLISAPSRVPLAMVGLHLVGGFYFTDTVQRCILIKAAIYIDKYSDLNSDKTQGWKKNILILAASTESEHRVEETFCFR